MNLITQTEGFIILAIFGLFMIAMVFFFTKVND